MKVLNETTTDQIKEVLRRIAPCIQLKLPECQASPIATDSPIRSEAEKTEVKPNTFCDTENGTDAEDVIVLPIKTIVLLCKIAKLILCNREKMPIPKSSLIFFFVKCIGNGINCGHLMKNTIQPIKRHKQGIPR